MGILISHWHCIIPVAAILLAMVFCVARIAIRIKKPKTKMPMNSWSGRLSDWRRYRGGIVITPARHFKNRCSPCGS